MRYPVNKSQIAAQVNIIIFYVKKENIDLNLHIS